MCILLCTQSSWNPCQILRDSLWGLFFFFLTTKHRVQSKFRESKLKHFLLFPELLPPRSSIMVSIGLLQCSTHHLSKCRVSFPFGRKNNKKKMKTWGSLKRRFAPEQANFLSGLFHVTVSSDLLQCALTSLNEKCKSFASCFLGLGYQKIKLRWISLEMSKSRKMTWGIFYFLSAQPLTTLQCCLAIFILKISPRKKWFNFLRPMVASTPASFPNWCICGETTSLSLFPQGESKLWLKFCWFPRNKLRKILWMRHNFRMMVNRRHF